MGACLFELEKLRVAISKNGFNVKALAVQAGLHIRTFERHFSDQFQTTPKAWIIRERMSFAQPLLAAGLSNKQVAVSLSYSCESNFCRDFKRSLGCTPQEFARITRSGGGLVAF